MQTNTGPVLSANTITVLCCLTYGLDLAAAEFIAALAAPTNTNTKEIKNEH